MANKQVKPAPYIDHIEFDPKDILSSLDVLGMSSFEFGIYCRLLFISWTQQPEQCYLKLDLHNICQLCKITPEEWDKVSQRILKKFKKTERHGETYIYNQRLLDTFNKQLKDLVSPEKVKADQLSFATEFLNYSFEQFWHDYDKKVGDKRRLYPKWMKLSDADREAIRADIPKRKELQPDKSKRPNAETYLNGRRWLDEYIDYRKPFTQTQAQKGNANYHEQKSNPV